MPVSTHAADNARRPEAPRRPHFYSLRVAPAISGCAWNMRGTRALLMPSTSPTCFVGRPLCFTRPRDGFGLLVFVGSSFSCRIGPDGRKTRERPLSPSRSQSKTPTWRY